jgi:hypothetical protein
MEVLELRRLVMRRREEWWEDLGYGAGAENR